jgi:putative DNA primase/helicase
MLTARSGPPTEDDWPRCDGRPPRALDGQLDLDGRIHRADGCLEELDDGAQDMWEPLVAIADVGGGDWPQRACTAALQLSGNAAREDDSLAALLLKDIYTVFSNGAVEHLGTADLIGHLAEIEESPWGDWHGKTITPHSLSRLLKPHRIRTMAVRVDGKTVRGYKVEQFQDAFHRVLGVRSVSSVRSGSTSQAAPNAPNAPNALDASTAMAGHLVQKERRYLKRPVADATHERIARDDGALKEECRRLAEAEEIERLAALAREAQGTEA